MDLNFSSWFSSLRRGQTSRRKHRRRRGLAPVLLALEERVLPAPISFDPVLPLPGHLPPAAVTQGPSGNSTGADSGGGAGQLSGGALVYQGGPLIDNVAVQPIFLQDSVTGNVDTPATQAQLDSFFNYITTSSFIPTLLSPYSVAKFPIGTGTVGANDANVQVVSKPYVDANGGNDMAVDDAQIQTVIQQEIIANRTAAPGPNNLYFVFAPPGDVVTAGGIGDSVTGFLGYHTSFLDSTTNTADYYAVIADPGAPNSNLATFGLTGFQQQAQVSSHELSEAVTDPTLPRGWTNPVTGGGWRNWRPGGQSELHPGQLPDAVPVVEPAPGPCPCARLVLAEPVHQPARSPGRR